MIERVNPELSIRIDQHLGDIVIMHVPHDMASQRLFQDFKPPFLHFAIKSCHSSSSSLLLGFFLLQTLQDGRADIGRLGYLDRTFGA